LPDTRSSMTHKFSISGHEGYITVGLYPDGRPGELFITMAKEGSTIGGLMGCFATAISMSLQYGVPLSVYAEKFSHTRFEPMGYTKNPDIPIAKSIVDYIFRWLGITFLPATAPTLKKETERGPSKKPENEVPGSFTVEQKLQPAVSVAIIDSEMNTYEELPNPNSPYADFQSDAPACDSCGAICVRSGNCYLCYNCGKSLGCS